MLPAGGSLRCSGSPEARRRPRARRHGSALRKRLQKVWCAMLSTYSRLHSQQPTFLHYVLCRWERGGHRGVCAGAVWANQLAGAKAERDISARSVRGE